MKPDDNSCAEPAVRLPCMCADLRRAARIVTQFYDDVLRPTGLRITQFTLLQALHEAPEISQKQLADILAIDSTTLTRTLAHLRWKRWLRAVPGTDRREIRLSLTAAGLREYKSVLPYWQSAQTRLKRAWGDESCNEAMNVAMRIAGATPLAPPDSPGSKRTKR